MSSNLCYGNFPTNLQSGEFVIDARVKYFNLISWKSNKFTIGGQSC